MQDTARAKLSKPRSRACLHGETSCPISNGRWRTQYGGPSPSEPRRQKQLAEENAKLERLVRGRSVAGSPLRAGNFSHRVFIIAHG